MANTLIIVPPPPISQAIVKLSVMGENGKPLQATVGTDPAWQDWFSRLQPALQTVAVLPSLGNSNQLLGVNAGGTALEYKTLGTQGVAGTLPVGSGGTGLNTFTIGDLLYASGATTLSRLADVAAGSFLRSGGIGSAPLWSTLTLPNSSSQGDLFLSASANVMTSLAKDTNATRYLANTGTSNNPAWDRVDLTNGVKNVLPEGNGGTGTGTTFTSGSVVFAGSSSYLQDNANFFWDSTNHFLGLGTASPAARLNLSANISASAWNLNGIALRVDAATYTDTTSVAGGNITASAFAIPTFANSAGGTNTYAKASTLYIAGAPLHGTGALFTNTYPLYIESGQGRSFLGDIVDVATGYRVNGSTSTTGQILRYDGTNFTPSTNTFPNTATRGDLLMATAANVVGSLVDIATGSALISGGVGAIPSYGKIGLTTHISGVLAEANGGTNQSTYTTGDLLYASAANTLSKLPDVAAGSYLRSGGVGIAPLWSTLTLPNAATTGDLLIASATNTISRLADVATGNALLSGGVGVAPAWGKVDLGTAVTGTLLAAQFPALTGDVTTVAGALATTLATVNSNVGTFGSATQVAQLTVNAKGLITAASNVTIASFGKNYVHNSGFSVDQLQTSSTSFTNNTHSIDFWRILTQTASVQVTQQFNQENGTPTNIDIKQNQAAAQRFGLIQPILSADCRDLRGQAIVLSARVRISNSQAVRYAILEWTGTRDSTNSNVVNDWTSSTYTAGNFFVAANVTVAAVGSLTPSANTWTSLTALTATISSSMNNMMVFFWTEGTAAQNVTLDIGRVKLEIGSTPTQWVADDFALTLVAAQQWRSKSFAYAQAPVQNLGTNAGSFETISVVGTVGSTIRFPSLRYTTSMLSTPTITLYNPFGANGEAYDVSGGGDCSGTTVNASTAAGFEVNTNADALIFVGARIAVHFLAEAPLG